MVMCTIHDIMQQVHKGREKFSWNVMAHDEEKIKRNSMMERQGRILVVLHNHPTKM